MSFKPVVQTDNTGKWYGNSLRFATPAEIEARVQDRVDRAELIRAQKEVTRLNAQIAALEETRDRHFALAVLLLDRIGARP